MINSKTIYNPKADKVSTPIQKIQNSFNAYQMTLVNRSDVTKSLIVRLQKVFDFKQDVDTLVAKWVKQDTTKFLRTLPLLIVKY